MLKAAILSHKTYLNLVDNMGLIVKICMDNVPVSFRHYFYWFNISINIKENPSV